MGVEYGVYVKPLVARVSADFKKRDILGVTTLRELSAL